MSRVRSHWLQNMTASPYVSCLFLVTRKFDKNLDTGCWKPKNLTRFWQSFFSSSSLSACELKLLRKVFPWYIKESCCHKRTLNPICNETLAINRYTRRSPLADKNNADLRKAIKISFTSLHARSRPVIPFKRPSEYDDGGQICKLAYADIIET